MYKRDILAIKVRDNKLWCLNQVEKLAGCAWAENQPGPVIARIDSVVEWRQYTLSVNLLDCIKKINSRNAVLNIP
jgi:hypothetical protein